MDFGSGDGWVSFQEPPKDKQTHSQQILGDKLPFPVTLTILDEKLTNSDVEFVEIGDYQFRTVQTAGVISEMTREDGKTTFLLIDPENTEKTFHAVQFGNVEDGGSKYVDPDLATGARVRVIGKLKNISGEKTILAYLIQKLADDKDYEIFKLEARAGLLFFETKMIEKMQQGDCAAWRGMLAPPFGRYHLPEFTSARNILVPEPTKTPKRDEASPSSSSTSFDAKSPKTPAPAPFIPVIPSNPHLNKLMVTPTRTEIQKPTSSESEPRLDAPPTPKATEWNNSTETPPAIKTTNALRAKIRALIRREETAANFESDDCGVSFAKIYESVSNVAEERVRATLKDMEEAGIIYSANEGEYRTMG